MCNLLDIWTAQELGKWHFNIEDCENDVHFGGKNWSIKKFLNRMISKSKTPISPNTALRRNGFRAA
jgi:hypothetical protein